MVADLSEGGVKIDGDHLKDLRACIVRLAAHYNYHAQRSSLEPHERPRFFGAEHSYSQQVEHGELGSTQVADEHKPIGDSLKSIHENINKQSEWDRSIGD